MQRILLWLLKFLGTLQYLQGNGAGVWQIERRKKGEAMLTLTFEKVVALFLE